MWTIISWSAPVNQRSWRASWTIWILCTTT
jgi:hypothetical protein